MNTKLSVTFRDSVEPASFYDHFDSIEDALLVCEQFKQEHVARLEVIFQLPSDPEKADVYECSSRLYPKKKLFMFSSWRYAGSLKLKKIKEEVS